MYFLFRVASVLLSLGLLKEGDTKMNAVFTNEYTVVKPNNQKEPNINEIIIKTLIYVSRPTTECSLHFISFILYYSIIPVYSTYFISDTCYKI